MTWGFGSIPVTCFSNMVVLLKDVVGKSEQRSRDGAQGSVWNEANFELFGPSDRAGHLPAVKPRLL